MYVHTNTHTHTYIFEHTHTHIHKHRYIFYTPRRENYFIHTYIYTYIYIDTLANMHATHACRNMNACLHTLRCAQLRVPRAYTYTHTYVHTYIHTQTYILDIHEMCRGVKFESRVSLGKKNIYGYETEFGK